MKLFGSRKNLGFLLGFLVFLLFSMALQQLLLHKMKDDEIAGKMQQFINSSMEQINEETQEIADMNENEREGFLRSLKGNLFEKTRKEFVIYDNDTLKQWTNNKIPIPSVKDTSLFDQHLEHFQNSWCLVSKKQVEQKTIIGLLVLKYDYPYENTYLKNQFNSNLDIPSNVMLSKEKGSHSIYYDGDIIVKLNFSEMNGLNNTHKRLFFLLFFIALLFLYGFLYNAHKALNPFPSKPKLFVLFYALDVIIIRILIAVFSFPSIIHDSLLFDPGILAINSFLPSLGDALLNVLTILVIVIAIYKEFHVKAREKDIFPALLINVISFVFIIGVIHGIYWTIKRFIWDSSVMMNLHEIFSVDYFTLMAFITLALLLISFYLLSVKILTYTAKSIKPLYAFLALIIAASMYFLIINFWGSVPWKLIAGATLFIVVFLIEIFMGSKLASLKIILINIIIFSAILTSILYTNNRAKEKKERKLKAVKLASKQDPVAETMFLEIEEKIRKDDTLRILSQPPMDEDLVISYILHNYFGGYWDKYNFQATICATSDSLILKPNGFKQNCKQFFENMIRDFGHFTFSKNLFYMDNDPWFSSYLAKIPLRRQITGEPLMLYLEMDAKFTPEGLVYPELLVDKNVKGSGLFSSGYSVAKYQNGELVASNGSYKYYINLKDYDINKNKKQFFNNNGYNHYYYPVSENELLIVSKKMASFTGKIAPFAYILIFLAIVTLILAMVINPSLFRNINRDFKTRLQIVFFAVLLFSFVFIGIISVIYLRNLNEEKNTKLLREKTHSILIEVEHKLSQYPKLKPEMYPYVNDLMYKFASVFFTDINMYSPEGKLIATSRPDIYEEGLVSRQISSDLYAQMQQKQRTMIIHKEKIGELEYFSAYMPFRNRNNEIIAYLNLPYYAKQSELENEIADFLAAFINLYVILLALAISLALLLTNYITQPLNLIKEHMRRIKLGAANEQIKLDNKDEIGDLVNEYNKMIDELERSTDLLMRSQRESAWREMAKQVAHEIKNPLTPMKLNVQQLRRSWDSNAGNQEEKMKRITDSLLEQIDNLSAIASEFSDFAKMPVSQPEIINLEDIVSHSKELYNNYEHVRIYFTNRAGNTKIKADYKQMIRVFNNILDNAIQAIPKDRKGRINIEITRNDDRLMVNIQDNGRGIPVEMQKEIFSPSFTTKSSGMGLGLSMVRSIINNSGGKVWFESVENEGTSFYVELPAYNK